MQDQKPTRHLQFWIAAIAITAINLGVWLVPRPGGSGSAEGPKPLRIDWSSGSSLIERSGRLDLVLDQQVFTPEQLGQPIDASPFNLEPAVPGVWEVSDVDSISFLPNDPLPAGNLLRVTADRSHPFFRPWSFDERSLPVVRYRPLVIEHVKLGDITTAETPGGARTATLEVDFDQPVLRSDLLEHLTLEVDGVAATIQPADDTAADEHALTINVKPGSQVTVAIDADLHGREGLLGIGDEFRRAFRVSPTLSVHWVDTYMDRYGDGRDGLISLYFDRQIAGGQTPVVGVSPDPGNVRVTTSGNQLRVHGRFQEGQAYQVTVDPPLMGADRSLLEEKIVRAVRMPTPDPYLSFEESEGQIVPGGRFELALRHRGYAKAQLVVHRLVDEHIAMLLGNFLPNYRIPRASELLFDRAIDLPTRPGVRHTTMLQLEDYIERRPGLYHITIKEPGNHWEQDSVILLVSDLAIDIEAGDGSMTTWVTSISTGQPVSGVDVTAWAPNITPLDSHVTGVDGVARIPLGSDEIKVITAKRGDDLVFVRPRRAAAIEDRDLAGSVWPAATDAAFYAERGVHRPGETLHLTAVVRTREGAPVTDTPYEVRWIRPDDRVERTIEAVTDSVQGVLHVDIETDALDPSGDWVAALHLPGSKTPVTTLTCPVMPFVPVRLRVGAEIVASDAPDDATVRSTTEYLHGAPAGGLDGTITARWTCATFSDTRFADFTFEPRQDLEIGRSTRDIRTDDLGIASVTFDAPEEKAVWNLRATVSISEPGGRATSASVESRIDTQRTHVGLRLPQGQIHTPGAPIPAELVVIVDGEPRTTDVPTLRILDIERDWSYERVDGSWKWYSTETATPLEMAVTIGESSATGVHTLQIPALSDGEYRIVATDSASGVESSIDFHVSRWRSEGRMAAERSDRLEIVPDRRTVLPGETLPVLVRSPFPGTALVSVETDKIVHSTVVTISGDGATVDLTIPDSARDTAFISAILVRPLDSDRNQWAPLLARGATRIEIDRTPHRLTPILSASSDARPGDVVPVSIVVPEASASAVVHLWAVEEGALLPTDYHVPNPMNTLLKNRRRMVNAFSSIVDLLPEYDRAVGTDAIGGDASARRREPVPIRLPETRVIWREAEVLGDDGRIEVDLTMPNLDGAMRLMAVVVDEDRYGATEQVVGVVPAIQIVTALPRTMSPSDLVLVPVTLRNNTAAATDVEIRIDATDRLVTGLSADVVRLEPGEARMLDLDLRPTRIGEAPITLRTTAQEGSGTTETMLDWQIAVRPPFGLQHDTQRLIVNGGETRTIERNRRLDALGGRIDVVVSAMPDIDLGPAVQDLIAYPYGCGEQIGSRIEGLLAALTVDPAVTMVDADSIRSMAAAGFARLWETQARDGRIPYWQGGSGNDWLTARTAMLLVRALDRDVPIPSGFEESIMNAVRGVVANGRIDRSTRILGIRALAEAGRAEPAAIETILLEKNDLSLAERAHLAASLAAQARFVDAMTMVDSFTVPLAMPPSDSGVFTSDTTDAAIALTVGLQVNPESPSLAALHDFVATRQGERRWRTTYETSASVEALTAWSRLHPTTGEARGTVVVAGHAIRFDGGEPVHVQIEIDPSDRPVGEDRIVSAGDAPLHVVVTTSGVPLEPERNEPDHRGLEITRRWLDAIGNEIDPSAAIGAGRTVVVEISYRSKIGADLANVAIVDVLPSGFEIELPTLLTAAAGETALDAVDRAEFRDDRVIVFDTATSTTQRFRYVARAVVPGDWARPGTVGESMYHDAVRSVLPLDRVVVELDRR